MKKLLLFVAALCGLQYAFAQGCTVNASLSRDTIVCGESVMLSAFGNAQGNAFLSENFNNGTYGPGWQSTQQAMWNNPCSPGGVDGTTHIWMGNSSPVPRVLTTTSFNLSSCANAGVTICFDMLFATQGNNAPCEGPDEPQEGVYLQYSTDNGATWTTLNYFDPNGGNDPQLVNWRNWCFPVPQAALTANTKFRWYQDADSGADYDHWGIDNVVIYCNDPTYSIAWPGGYTTGGAGGANPTPYSPSSTTTYVVTMSNGTNTCADTVTINVVNPIVVANAGLDTAICSGTCVALNADGKVVQRPAKTPTYSNQEIAQISGTPGFPGIPPLIPPIPGGAFLAMDINVTNLNLNTVTPNYITSVCIGNVTMSGFFGGIEIFDIWLVCPSGDSILLVKDSTLTGASLTNTCFVPAGSNITSATSPYSGNFAPNQPFSNLAGCDANGVWSLHLNAVINSVSLPIGVFNNWSITFNDPEVSYTGNFTWSPTANMTNSNTLTPTVCPVPNEFVLTVSDTAGCVTRTDTVRVSTYTCCNFNAAAVPSQATCGQNDGAIDITMSPTANYTYAWSDGPATTPNRTGLGAGTYTVTITDANGCSSVETIVVGAAGAPTISVATTGTGCATNTGSATVSILSGTASGYQWSNGATTASATNLAAGTYTVTVTAPGGCTVTASAVVNAGGSIAVSASATNTTCGNSNGTATVTVTQGTASTYNWSNGGNSAQLTGLANGTYTVTVSDASGCTATASVIVGSSLNNTVSITSNKQLMCAGDTATICAPAGYASYAWNTGETSACISATLAGNYYVTVTDNTNCSAASNQLPVNTYPQPPVSISVNEDSLLAYGSAGYQWYRDGQAIPGATGGLYVANESGSYTVLVTDQNGCTALSLPVVVTVTGIDDMEEDRMSVYPNPNATAMWNIAVSKGWIGAECEVYNAEGRLVYQTRLYNQRSEIELNVATGVYMLRISAGNRAITQKLMKM